jgi:iron(III) transport system permease protein
VIWTGVGFRAVEPELEESARLDLPAWRVVWSVSVRRSIGAIAGGALAVAVLTAGDMTVTDLVQVRTYAEEAYVQAQLGNGPAAAAKVTIPPLVVLGIAILAGSRMVLRADPARIASASARARTWGLGAWRVPLGIGVWVVTGGILFIPIYGLLWRAGRVAGSAELGVPPHWSAAGLLGTLRGAWPDVVMPSYLRPSALWTSILCAGLAATAVISLAWPLAWYARNSRHWRVLAAACAALALATPGPIAGLALKLAYLRIALVHDTIVILVLALLLRVLPYAFLLLWAGVRAIPDLLLEAAAVDGYGPWGRTSRIVIPLSLRTAGAAWLVSFVLALGELPATNIVRPPGYTTLSFLVWHLLHTGVESHLAGVGLLLLVFFALAGWTAERVLAAVGAGWITATSRQT